MPPINTESTRSPGIKALCSQLGYNEAKESPRHYTCLATPLRQFRSLNKAYDVPRCALEFCERNEKDKHFFTSSRQARRNGWPVLPDDKDRIIETITRIIHIQDSHTRETERTTRNRNILSGLLNGDKPSKSNDYTGDHDGGSLESTTNVGTTKGTVVRIKREEAELAEEAGLAVTRREDEIEANTRSKTSEHLTWAYPEGQGLDHGYLPCDIRRDALATGHPRLNWLFHANPNVHWPDEPRSYVWRYMHHKSVYSLAPEFDKMQDLADDFIRHLRITCNPGQFSAIFDKLKYFVALWTRNWLDCGMLQEDGGLGLSRSNEFEYQLKLRQAIWPAQEETLGESPRKRAGESVRQPAPNKRRRRTYAYSTPISYSNRDDGERAFVSRESSTEEVIVLDTTGVGSPGESAAFINVSEYHNVYDPPNRKTPAVNSIITAEKTRDVSPDEIRCHVEENSRGSPTTHIGEPGPIPLRPVSQCHGLSSFNTEGPNTLETPSQSPGATSHAVSKSASSDHQVTSALTSQEPPKIKLFLQNTDGEVDFQNPLPSREFKDATLPEFFAIFSKRSSLDTSMLKSLTFVVVFAHHLLLKVNQSDNEKKWLNLKRRISYLFKETMAEWPQETEFEVWVVEDNDLAGL
ncbi:hypothetical protein IFR04_012590 [Cadophora malorum]|uniref:Uncharacterized protein n=1 Tax=Cadophora malorum TaxID=108018 RepID=A0A8H7T6F3_9HELO|nr:hypothetical protein IFR04_012590 [Cadophora malorum]